MATETKTIARDVRVDRVGYVQELLKLWSNPIKDAVKESMTKSGLILVTGDRYEGKLSPTTSTSTDARKFYKLFKAGKIKEADFLIAIKVERGPLKAFLSEKEIAALTETEKGTPRFTVDRAEGIDVTLAEAIRQLTATLAGAAEPGK